MAQPTRQAPLKGASKLVIFALTSASELDTTAAHTYERFENETFNGYHTLNNVVLDFTSHEDQETLDTHLTSYLIKDPVSAVDIVYSNGVSATYKDSADDTKLFGWVYYGGEVNNKHAVHYGLGVYTGDTGSRGYSANTLGGTTIQLTSVEASVQVTFPSLCLDTTLVTGLADLTLATGANSTVTYLTKS